MPTSSTADVHARLPEVHESGGGHDLEVGRVRGDRAPAAEQAAAASRTAVKARARWRSEIGRPDTAIRSFTRTRCGEV